MIELLGNLNKIVESIAEKTTHVCDVMMVASLELHLFVGFKALACLMDGISEWFISLWSYFSVEEEDAYNTKQSCAIFAWRFLGPDQA